MSIPTKPTNETSYGSLERRIAGLPVGPVLMDLLYKNIRLLRPEQREQALENLEGQFIDRFLVEEEDEVTTVR